MFQTSKVVLIQCLLLMLCAEGLVASMEALCHQTNHWAAAFDDAACHKSRASTEVYLDTTKHWSVSDRLEESVQQLVNQHRLSEAILNFVLCSHACDCTKVHMTF